MASDGGLITQGDNRLTNPGPDEPIGGPYVHQQCLVGKVVFIIPYLERLADLLPYPTNYILAALVILFVIFSEMTGAGGKKEGVASPPPAMDRIEKKRAGGISASSLTI